MALAAVLAVITIVKKKGNKSKKSTDKDKTSSKEKSDGSSKGSGEAVPSSPSGDHNRLSYEPIGYSNNIALSRETLPDRALGMTEDQEASILRSDKDFTRQKSERDRKRRELRTMNSKESEEEEENERNR